MRVARRELIVPLSRARGWIESDHGTGKQVIALANGSVQARARVAHRPIEHVQIGIVAARQPCAAAAVFPAVPAPGLVTKLARSGDGVEAPQPLTCGRVVRIDEAANAKFSSGYPNDDLVFDRQGRSGNRIALERIGHLGFPKHTSGASIQRDQSSVERAEEYPAAQYSRAAIEGVYLVRTYYLLPSLKFPNLKSRPGVDGEHLSRRSGGIHNAVYYQRRRLQYGTPGHLCRPSRLQLADICRGDLMQGSEVLPL